MATLNGKQEPYPPGSYPLQAGYPQDHPVTGFAPAPPYPQQQGYIPPSYPTQGVPAGYPKQEENYPGVYPGPPAGDAGYAPPPPVYEQPNVNMADEEESHFKSFDFSEESIRKAFVRKVYSILMLQLLVTASIISIFVYQRDTKLWCQDNIWLVGVAAFTSIILIIVMSCFDEVRRRSPTNLIFLGIFTLAQSFMLGVVSATYDGNEVMLAMGITGAICFGLTLFALQTKWDFTMMGGGLICALIVLTLFGTIAFWIDRSMQLRLWVAAIGVFLFSLYLIYDTQLMMGGKHKYTLSPEEYVFAALSLYLDIINIFIRILLLFGKR